MPVPILSPAQMRAIRTDLGVTQAVLALAMGYHPQHYRKWEQGHRIIPDYACDQFFAAVDTLRATRVQRIARRDALLAALPRAS